MNWEERLDKLLSREFLLSLALAVVFVVAFFAQPTPIEFGDFAFWLCVVTGISTGALTVQKVGGKLLKRE